MIHTISIPNWHPHKLNELINANRYAAARMKKEDALIIAHYGRLIPRATGKRRVSLHIVLAPRQRAGDPDCYWKSLLDGCVKWGLLFDDNRQWCELVPVMFSRGGERQTIITLEDMP